jgi:hypothetical protein
MEMFVKRYEKNTLETTFTKAIKFEKDVLDLKGNPEIEPSKDKTGNKTKATVKKPSKDKKDSESTYVEALHIIVKKLTNEIIDLKKNCGEGSSNPNFVFKFQPKKEKSTPPANKATPPYLEDIKMEDIFSGPPFFGK